MSTYKGVASFKTAEWNRTTFTILRSASFDMYFLFKAPVLQTIYIQHNQKVFQLLIDHCALMEIPRTISLLPALQRLIIRFCQLRYLDLNDFLRVPLLKTVDLSHNQILTILELPVTGVQLPIRELFLVNNSLHYVNMSWFGEMNELKCLHLDWNQLEDVDVAVPMPNLQELSVSHNRLRMLNLTRWSFLPRLKNINGSHNRLSSAPAGWNALIRLETIELSFNHIGSFNMDDLYLTQVRGLNLAANELTSVSTSVLHLRVPLEKLRMSHNRLTVLDVSRWGMPNLWELDVSHNRLTDLGDVCTRFSHLTQFLNLCENNWACQWFRRIHPEDLKRLQYGKLLTNESCPDQKYIITEQAWICCRESNV